MREENESLRADVVANRKQVDSLLSLAADKKRPDLITHADSIELGDYTAAYNPDATQKTPNSVKVYLLPKDASGSVVKAAGAVQIKLFDLNAPDGQNLIGDCNIPAEEVFKNWYSGFLSMTYHYSFVCPWKHPPTKNEVLVRVEFTDYLTGKHFTAIKTVTANVAATLPVK